MIIARWQSRMRLRSEKTGSDQTGAPAGCGAGGTSRPGPAAPACMAGPKYMNGEAQSTTMDVESQKTNVWMLGFGSERGWLIWEQSDCIRCES